LAISKERKRELVAMYGDLMERSEALILMDFQGLNVAQITKLRNEVREAKGMCYVTKNTLIKRAMEQAGISAPEEWFVGPTAISFCFEDVQAVAKAVTGFASESEILKIKGALLGDRPVSEAKVKTLASLPPEDILRGLMLGTLTSPLSGLVGVLNGVLAGLIGVLDARSEQLGESGAA